MTSPALSRVVQAFHDVEAVVGIQPQQFDEHETHVAPFALGPCFDGLPQGGVDAAKHVVNHGGYFRPRVGVSNLGWSHFLCFEITRGLSRDRMAS